MFDEDGEASDEPVAPCGHPNPPRAHFCDVCGAALPMQCPHCHATNRRQAHFCNMCGSSLRDGRPYATPSAAEPPPPARSPETEPDPAPAPTRPSPRWTAASGRKPAAPGPADVKRLEDMQRYLRQRRRSRHTRAWVGIVCATFLVALFAAGLVRAYIATRGGPRAFIDTETKAPTPVRAERGGSAAVADRPPVPTGPADPTVAPDRSESAPFPGGSPAVAATEPLVGGTLTFLVPGEPPSYDAHREETFALMHPAAPHYNTLLRIDPLDPTGTRVVGDLATSWAVSADKRTYVLKLRQGVKFHDGSEMTSRDVRATYEKIINPPPGITSARKGEYLQIETVQAPEPYIVAFKLKWPSPSFIHSLASPWNWIYKADILERDVRWYERNIMGT
ncbi:MAG TPA: ABC transporter substrate-binding protein, partial [Methylomirabilota bacterium]